MIISNLALVVRGAEVILLCLFVFAVVRIFKLASESQKPKSRKVNSKEINESTDNEREGEIRNLSAVSPTKNRKTGPAEIHAFRFMSAQFDLLKGHWSVASASNSQREASLSYFVAALNFIAIHYEYKSDERFQLIRHSLQAHGDHLGLHENDSKGLAEAIKSVLNKDHKQFAQTGGLAVKEWILYDKLSPKLTLRQLLCPAENTEQTRKVNNSFVHVAAKAS